METKYIYTIHNSSDKFDYNSNTNKFEIKYKHTSVEILEGANDLRYCGWGIQPIWSVSIFFPWGSIGKTLRRKDDADLSKVMEYVNKKLKKEKFQTINFEKDAVQHGVSPRSWWIRKIQKKENK